MFEWLNWFTDMQNTKPFALVLFFTCFIGIIAYVFVGKKRSKRFEEYRYIPFMDDDDAEHKDSEHKDSEHKDSEHKDSEHKDSEQEK